MNILDEARTALLINERARARDILQRLLQRESQNGEAWYLLAEAADDFQEQTYALGMATRCGYRPPTTRQPEVQPTIINYYTVPPANAYRQRPFETFEAIEPIRERTKGPLQQALESLLLLIMIALAALLVYVLVSEVLNLRMAASLDF